MSKRFVELAFSDLANQLAFPVKSVTGSALTRWQSKRSTPIVRGVLEKVDVKPDSRLLEIGYGRGNGIGEALKRVSTGSGVVFGIERSPYMEEVTRKRFILEEREQGKLVLDRCFDLRHLAYPSEFFDVVFHVDLFYFIKQESMLDVCRELHRVMKPEAVIACGMQISSLDKLEKWGLLTRSQTDPMRYLHNLEPAGFEQVKMEYLPSPAGEIQVISARKPAADASHSDPDQRMAELERDIKREMLRQTLVQTGKTPTKEDLELLKE
ncbi:hypothetical protein PRIPAC_74153 [Pristionchus pacificus]|uniref:Methyltransferase n=1 Tax=Pristionchus pacificus TaxID=54126 RepID=A0A454Y313_PRIPA|nr:hypothetical protein PRIPAC_74153 [Pristionchus pacificus]|eukprot:PDM76650.1 methyltransferase [Pristionchus pacificus]